MYIYICTYYSYLKKYLSKHVFICGYNEKLNYTEENNEINKKYQKRNILWFRN